jgi:DNA-binding transcriptional ArsR family regulator
MPEPTQPRKITDAGALRALAHPLRLRLMEELLTAGSATATELAELVGESPANCSWHLRLLAKYGYIEEAGEAHGRQRPWRLVIESRSWGADDDDVEFAAASHAAEEILFDHEYRAFRDRERWKSSDPPEWRDAAASIQSVAWLTVDELKELHTELFRLMSQHFDRLGDPAARPADARLVRMVAWAVPAHPMKDPARSGENPVNEPASATQEPNGGDGDA